MAGSDRKPAVNLFRDRVVRGSMSLEEYARTLIRMDGSSPGPACLGPDQGARLPGGKLEAPAPRSLFDGLHDE
jgi:hypothetical protein